MNLEHIRTIHHDDLVDLAITLSEHTTMAIWGAPGIGKTESINRLGAELGLPTVRLLASQMNPEDLSVPLIDPETRTTSMCPQQRLVESPKLIFIDEFNAAHDEVLRPLMTLVNEHYAGDQPLPAGSRVIVAMNTVGQNSLARELPSPMMSRLLHLHLKLRSTDSWLEHVGGDLHPMIHEFVRQYGMGVLLPERNYQDDQLATNPRSWVTASRALKAFEELWSSRGYQPTHADYQQVCGSAVADKEATKFGDFCNLRLSGLRLGPVLRGEVGLPQDQLGLIALTDQLISRLSSELPNSEVKLTHETQTLRQQGAAVLRQLIVTSPELGSRVTKSALPSYLTSDLADQLDTISRNHN